MFMQEDIHRPEKPLAKTREIDNEARIPEKSRDEKKIQQKSEVHNSLRHPAKLSNILGITRAILKDFAIFTGKYLCWSRFLIKNF